MCLWIRAVAFAAAASACAALVGAQEQLHVFPERGNPEFRFPLLPGGDPGEIPPFYANPSTCAPGNVGGGCAGGSCSLGGGSCGIPAAGPAAAVGSSCAPGYGNGLPACAPDARAACGDECCFGPCGCEPLWTVRADALFLQRSSPRPAVLVSDPAGNSVLNAGDFGFRTATGYDLDVIWHHVWGSCWDLEGLYFDVDSFNASPDLVFAPALSTVRFANPALLPAPSIITANYNSQLRNAEFNGRRELFGGFWLLAGFRYLELKEQLSGLMQAGAGQGQFTVDADNFLAGFQIGAESRLWRCGPLEFEGLVKAGIFNDHVGNSGVLSGPGIAPVGTSAHADHTAFAGQLGLTGLCALSESWAVRAGYELLWLDGVALAPAQFTAIGAGAVNTANTAFYQGAYVGLEFRR